MTDQQVSNENDGLLNFDQAKTTIEKNFAAMVGTLSLNNAILEKRLSISQQAVRQLTEHEVGLVEHIQDLEADLARLRHRLSSLPQPLSPEAAALAAAGGEIIQDEGGAGKKKPPRLRRLRLLD